MELLKKYRVPVFFLVGFVIYTILVRTIDVKTIGPQGSRGWDSRVLTDCSVG